MALEMNLDKNLSAKLLDGIKMAVKQYNTPFYLYDEFAIRQNVKNFLRDFSWNKNFKEFFAVKALPNPYILQILRSEGLGVDCSSMAELVLAEKSGFSGEEIIFTSNNTPVEDYQKALELGAIINLDDITHIEFLENNLHLPEFLCFRYNPAQFQYANSIIGSPRDAKFGLTEEQLFRAYDMAKKRGVKRFGLHTMVASNELDPECFIANARVIFNLALQIMQQVDITFEIINLGGGLGIPYHLGVAPIDIQRVALGVEREFNNCFGNNAKLPYLAMENGRYITGSYGYLITKVIHTKDTYKHYLGVDATMADLMRPGMYGAYHHISVLDKDQKVKDSETDQRYVYDVVGSLCENNDKFAIDRVLPQSGVGDILVIHDAGAHAHAMGFNYNGKLRPAEVLLNSNGQTQLIRRAERLDDYFATLDFSKLSK